MDRRPERAGLRTRWAALGAAVAVSLGAGGVHLAAASSPDPSPVLTTISPCRLLDTRPAPDNVGPRSTPLGPGETFTTQVRGAQGQCSVPTSALGVVLNVTAVSPTAASFLTVWPAGAARPSASNLNWVAGQAPTPNQVTAALAADGRLSLFNHAGTVHVVVDVTGYLSDHDHDDQYAAAPGGTVHVVRGDGAPAANGAAFRSALEGITDATAARPHSVQLGPGTFDLGAEPLEVPSFVSIVGAGQLATTVRSSASAAISDSFNDSDQASAITLGDGNELHDLTIRSSANDGDEYAIGLFVRARTIVEDITVVASPGPATGTSWGVLAIGTIDFVARSSTFRAEGGIDATAAFVVVSALADVRGSSFHADGDAPSVEAVLAADILSDVSISDSELHSSAVAIHVLSTGTAHVATSLVDGAVIDETDPENGELRCVGTYDIEFAPLDDHCEPLP